MRTLVAVFVFFLVRQAQAQVKADPAENPATPQPVPALTLRDLSGSLETLAERVRPSVVQIFSTSYAPTGDADSPSNFSRQRSTGSGVIVSADGFILTNAHVVRGARRIQVRLPYSRRELGQHTSVLKPEGRLLNAKLVGSDMETDLAVVKIEATELRHLTFGDSEGLHLGQVVVAFGNPLGLEGSVSMGVVSSTARQIRPEDTNIYVQTDAPINPGNSGGPLVNSQGQVVGINTFIMSQSGGSEGLGFAIPSNIARNVMQQLRQHGRVHRGRIGVYAQSITPTLARGLKLEQNWGVLAGDVEPNGPADKAGVKIGDIIVSVNGKKMENARQLEVNLYRYPDRDKVDIEVLRGTEKHSLQVIVMEQIDDPQRFSDLVTPENNLVARLGILAVSIDKQLAGMLPNLRQQYGVVVAAGSVDDLGSGTGLKPGDVIYAVGDLPVTNVDALRRSIEDIKPGEAAVLQIERTGRLMYVALELE